MNWTSASITLCANGVSLLTHVPIYSSKCQVANQLLQTDLMDLPVSWFAARIISSIATWTHLNIEYPYRVANIPWKIQSVV